LHAITLFASPLQRTLPAGLIYLSGGAGRLIPAVDFLSFSLAIASIFYVVANKLLLSPSAHSAVSENRVEFAYAFDVAVNSFFPAFLTIYVALLPLVGVVVRDRWVCLWVGK
jgi:hypothetical protein